MLHVCLTFILTLLKDPDLFDAGIRGDTVMGPGESGDSTIKLPKCVENIT